MKVSVSHLTGKIYVGAKREDVTEEMAREIIIYLLENEKGFNTLVKDKRTGKNYELKAIEYEKENK